MPISRRQAMLAQMSEHHGPPPAPVLIREHLGAYVGATTFFGRLVVMSGEARFEPAGLANSLVNVEPPPTVRHRDRTVVVVFGRFMLPWMNTGIVLTDQETIGQFTATLIFPTWQRRAIVIALRQAGFAAEVYRTPFSAGRQIGSATELQRFRQQHRALH